jgi:hypothetical protein
VPAPEFGSDLEARAAQVRTDAERASQFRRYEGDVRVGRAKPPAIKTPRYLLGCCLRCGIEIWVTSPRPRVPVCKGCLRASKRSRRQRRAA